MPGDTVKTLDSGDRTRSRRFVLEGPVHLPACGAGARPRAVERNGRTAASEPTVCGWIWKVERHGRGAEVERCLSLRWLSITNAGSSAHVRAGDTSPPSCLSGPQIQSETSRKFSNYTLELCL